MYAIMGATGNVGGALAEALLARHTAIRVILRNPGKANHWQQRGAEVAIADYNSAEELARAFTGAEGVFVMVPPNFAPSPGYLEPLRAVEAIAKALDQVRPPKAVYLSSIGAEQPDKLGLITSLHILEETVRAIPIAHAFLRASWFMENFAGDAPGAIAQGKVRFHLSPLDRRFPMVATADIGQAAAKTLLESWQGVRAIEVNGPANYSPFEVAAAFSRATGRTVEAISVPRDQWTASFLAQGMPEGRTEPRAEMVDGFNNGWIHFNVPGTERYTGSVELAQVISRLVA